MTIAAAPQPLLVFSIVRFHARQAQEMIKPPIDSPETNVAERVRLLESELERQNSKARPVAKDTPRTAADDSGAARKTLTSTSSDVATAKETGTTGCHAITRRTAANTNRRTTSRESRRPGIENRSGSSQRRLPSPFRRHFRSATEPPDPPLEHVQNSRARYRFRLNFDTDHPSEPQLSRPARYRSTKQPALN